MGYEVGRLYRVSGDPVHRWIDTAGQVCEVLSSDEFCTVVRWVTPEQVNAWKEDGNKTYIYTSHIILEPIEAISEDMKEWMAYDQEGE
jgi:hypothetical protein